MGRAAVGGRQGPADGVGHGDGGCARVCLEVVWLGRHDGRVLGHQVRAGDVGHGEGGSARIVEGGGGAPERGLGEWFWWTGAAGTGATTPSTSSTATTRRRTRTRSRASPTWACGEGLDWRRADGAGGGAGQVAGGAGRDERHAMRIGSGRDGTGQNEGRAGDELWAKVSAAAVAGSRRDAGPRPPSCAPGPPATAGSSSASSLGTRTASRSAPSTTRRTARSASTPPSPTRATPTRWACTRTTRRARREEDRRHQLRP